MNEGGRSVIEDVLPDFESICKAPTLVQLVSRAQSRGVEVDVVLEEERRKRYKSIDSTTGSIYLIANPVSWLSTPQGFVRPPPQFQCSVTDARRGLGPISSKKAGSAREAF